MDDAYTYVRAQLLGMAFEPCVIAIADTRYTWSGRSGWLLRWLISVGQESLARWLFGALVEVTPWQP